MSSRQVRLRVRLRITVELSSSSKSMDNFEITMMRSRHIRLGDCIEEASQIRVGIRDRQITKPRGQLAIMLYRKLLGTPVEIFFFEF
jgi:hypothetical protein